MTEQWWHAYSATLNGEKSFLHCIVIYAECPVQPIDMPVVVEETIPRIDDEDCPEELQKYFDQTIYMTYENSFDHEPTEEQKFWLLPDEFRERIGASKIINIQANNRNDPRFN